MTRNEAQKLVDKLIKAEVLVRRGGYLMGGSYVNPTWDVVYGHLEET